MRFLKATSKTHPREYASWAAMKQRCLNEKHPSYKYYGGRGVTICKEWVDSFDQFVWDMGLRPYGTSIDRVNNDKLENGYSPDNCRWERPFIQVHNSSKLKLTEIDVERIRTMEELDILTHDEIAYIFGVARSTVTNILRWNTRLGDTG